MARFSPKIEIINYFDNLINRVDIDIDNCLEKYNDAKVLGELLKSSENNRRNLTNENVEFYVEYFKTSHKYETLDLWTESTKVSDYLKQVRMETIDELRMAQDEALEYYKYDSARFKSELYNGISKNIDEFRSEFFADNFYFQINFTQSEKRCWPFNVFTFITDFYMSPSDIDSLEKLINDEKGETLFGRNCVFDDKMVLIGLLYKNFIDNLYNFPNHLIGVCKEEVSNIKKIYFNYEYSQVNLTRSSTIDLSKLVALYIQGDSKERRESVKINLEGLSSLKTLHLGANSTEMHFSIRNLNSLSLLGLYNRFSIDENIISQLADQVRHIENLNLFGNLSHFNLDHFYNLNLLFLIGTITESFNIDLFKNLCNQIRFLNIELTNIEEKTFFKLFNGHNFPELLKFSIMKSNIKQLKKENFNWFPNLNFLYIIGCNLEMIENDVFSNMKHLLLLDLSENRLKFIEENTFSNLKNLEILDLSSNSNELKSLDAKFIGVRNSVEVLLENKSLATFKRYWK